LDGDPANQLAAAQLGFDQSHQQLGRRHRGVDPKSAEELDVVGVVDPGNRARHVEFALGQLAGDQVVLVVTGGADHDIGTLDAGGGEEGHLVTVTAHDGGGSKIVLDVG